MKPAVVLVAHGSPEAEGNAAFLGLVAGIRGRRPEWRVEGGFLDHARPPFREVLGDTVAGGCSPVAVQPCFLFPGGRVEEEIAAGVGETAKRRPDAVIRVARPLAEHEATPDVLADEITVDAMTTPRSVAVLVAAGSVAFANRDAVERLAGVVRMRLGISIKYGYLDEGEPLMATVMSETLSARPPFVCVLPCLLFPGLFMRDLSRAIEGWRMSYEGVRIHLGKPLVEDPRMATIIEAEARRLLA